MAHIHAVGIQNDNTYLIQPLLYATASYSNNVYQVTLPNFEVTTGASIYIEVSVTNAINPKLNINNTSNGDLPIIYEGTSLQANMLSPGRTYNLVYNGIAWMVTGELCILPLASNGTRGGVQIGYQTSTENKNYAVELSGEKMFVHVPWTDSYTWNDIGSKPTTLAGYGITDAKIENDTITLGQETILPIVSINGNTGPIVSLTAADFGLEDALHFIGVVSANSSYQPSDGTNGRPTITGVQDYSPSNGDVILDQYSLREYVYANSTWVLLGYTTSTIYDSNNISSTQANVPNWISRIIQRTDGSIEIEHHTMGTLPIAYGGTGESSFTQNQVVLTENNSTVSKFVTRGYSDNNLPTALSNSSTNFITERSIYFGLPSFNNAHNYTSNISFFAATSGGTQYQILVSNGNNAPIWAEAATIISETSTTSGTNAYTNLILGNNIAASAVEAHSEGQIYLYSSSTGAHIINGSSTSTNYTHTFPNKSGIVVQTSSANANGSNTCPVYIDTEGEAKALTYTQNRLYYSASTSSFSATDHYASATQIGLGTTTLPANCSATLYVNGTSIFNGNATYNEAIYLAGGTDYYIDNLASAKFKNITVGSTLLNGVYAINIIGDTYIDGTHYFGDDTDYYIDENAIGYLPDFRSGKVRLTNNWIGFYETDNATDDRYSYIQSVQDILYFRQENGTTGITPAFDFNGEIVPNINNLYNIGSNFFRWKDLYLQGNLVMQDMGVPQTTTATANKITWSSTYSGAEIYYGTDVSIGKLFINTKDNTDSLVTFSYGGVPKICINSNASTLYPETNNTGTLGIGGLDPYRWSKVYIGTADSYGDAYTPVYWNNGTPAAVALLQYQAFTILSGNDGVKLSHDAFTADSYVSQIVVTGGEANLNSAISWTSGTGYIDLVCSTAPSGNVTGYIVVGRGAQLQATATAITTNT